MYRNPAYLVCMCICLFVSICFFKLFINGLRSRVRKIVAKKTKMMVKKSKMVTKKTKMMLKMRTKMMTKMMTKVKKMVHCILENGGAHLKNNFRVQTQMSDSIKLPSFGTHAGSCISILIFLSSSPARLTGS